MCIRDSTHTHKNNGVGQRWECIVKFIKPRHARRFVMYSVLLCNAHLLSTRKNKVNFKSEI